METLHNLVHGQLEGLLLFMLGMTCYVLLRADYAVKSKSNGVTSILQYLRLHTVALFVRVTVATVGFFGVIPTEGLNLPGVSEWAMYFFSGLGIDGLLDKICQKVPFLRVKLPSINGTAIGGGSNEP